jgi:hypothetical protein
LARESLVFRRAYSPSASTGPTLAAWGDAGRLWDADRPGSPRLHRALGAAGYRRICIFPWFWATTIDASTAPQCDVFERLDKLAWIDDATTELGAEAAGKPLFVQIHLMETHGPLAPTDDPVLGRGPRAAWRAAARRTDRFIARFFARLRSGNWLRDAVVIVSADHGEAFGEHGSRGHATFLYEEETHVPLFIWSAWGIAGARVEDRPVSNGWIGPTLLALTGRVPPEQLGGPTILDGPVYLRQGVFHGLVRGRHKVIVDTARNTVELYDVVADPGETRNLVDREPATRQELLGALRALTPRVPR